MKKRNETLSANPDPLCPPRHHQLPTSPVSPSPMSALATPSPFSSLSPLLASDQCPLLCSPPSPVGHHPLPPGYQTACQSCPWTPYPPFTTRPLLKKTSCPPLSPLNILTTATLKVGQLNLNTPPDSTPSPSTSKEDKENRPPSPMTQDKWEALPSAHILMGPPSLVSQSPLGLNISSTDTSSGGALIGGCTSLDSP